MSDLLPCPFCGRKVYFRPQPLSYRGASFRVQCLKCDLDGPRRWTANGAVNAWNRRAAVSSDASRAE